MRRWQNALLTLLPPLVIPLICGTAVKVFINLYSPLRFAAFAAVYTAVFFLCMWRWGMNEAERDIFKKPVWGLCKR